MKKKCIILLSWAIVGRIGEPYADNQFNDKEGSNSYKIILGMHKKFSDEQQYTRKDPKVSLPHEYPPLKLILY